jgi:RNA polymerase sigma-70 factor, ECF subfamily
MSAAEPTDHELVVRAQDGDGAAFAALARRHRDRVYRLALRITRDAQDAEDVLQETFLSVYRKLDEFREEAAFTTWLHRVAANHALMKLRKRRSTIQTTSMDEVGERFDEGGNMPTPGGSWHEVGKLDAAEKRELRERINQAVDELPEIYREVFLLRDVEELSTEEVADVVGIGVPNVKTRLHRARLLLREKLTAAGQAMAGIGKDGGDPAVEAAPRGTLPANAGGTQAGER